MRACARASRISRSRRAGSRATADGSTLIATGRSSARSVARYTSPIPPAPRARSIRKCPSCWPATSSDPSTAAARGAVAVRAESADPAEPAEPAASVSSSSGRIGAQEYRVGGPTPVIATGTMRAARQRARPARASSRAVRGAMPRRIPDDGAARILDSLVLSHTFVSMSAPDRSWTVGPALLWFTGCLIVLLCVFDGGVEVLADRFIAPREPQTAPAAGPTFTAKPVEVAEAEPDEAAPPAPTIPAGDRSRVLSLEDFCIDGTPEDCKRWGMDAVYRTMRRAKQRKLGRALRISWYGD